MADALIWSDASSGAPLAIEHDGRTIELLPGTAGVGVAAPVEPGPDLRRTLRRRADDWMQAGYGSGASIGAARSLERRRFAFAATAAAPLARAALPGGGPGDDVGRALRPVRPSGWERIPTGMVPFETADGDVLVVVVGAHEAAIDVPQVLPAALRLLRERELRLVVPRSGGHALAGQLPWLDLGSRLFTHLRNDPGSVQAVPLPTRSMAVDDRREGPVTLLGDGAHPTDGPAGRLRSPGALRTLGLDPAGLSEPPNPPARAAPGRAAIDLLGRGTDGRIHVVVTSVGHDPMLALDGLDHLTWVRAHASHLAMLLGASPELPPLLDLVVRREPGRPLLDRSAQSTLERLGREVDWRLWEDEGDVHDQVVLTPVWWNRVSTGDRWSDRMAARASVATHFAGVDLVRGRHVPELSGVAPGCDATVADLLARDAVHGGFGLPRSSQRFAVNLFGALGSVGASRLLAHWFGAMADADEPVLEWTDPPDRLCEATVVRPHQTQVDVMLRGRTAAGATVMALIEVKLTEAAFGDCSHAEDAPPERRDACLTSGPFGRAPDVCWQLANRELGVRRRYDRVLAVRAEPPPDPPTECWFRALNQPMRSAALAAALVQDGDATEVVVALCAPSGHQAMWRQWRQSRAVLAERLEDLDPAVVSAALPPPTQVFLTDRYGIVPAPVPG